MVTWLAPTWQHRHGWNLIGPMRQSILIFCWGLDWTLLVDFVTKNVRVDYQRLETYLLPFTDTCFATTPRAPGERDCDSEGTFISSGRVYLLIAICIHWCLLSIFTCPLATVVFFLLGGFQDEGLRWTFFVYVGASLSVVLAPVVILFSQLGG